MSSLLVGCVVGGLGAGCPSGNPSPHQKADAAIEPKGNDGGTPSPPPDDGGTIPPFDAETPIEDAGPLPDPLNDSGVSIGSDGSRAEFCAGKGSPVELRVPTGDAGVDAGPDGECTMGLASRIFQFGICSCSDVTLPGAFTIEALDSDHPDDHNPTGASVGVNRNFIASGSLTVQGSLIVAGNDTLNISGSGYHVQGNLRTNSDLSFAGQDIVFGRDLWVNGNIFGSGTATAERDLYQTPNHELSPTLTVGGSVYTQDFKVEPPCPCAEDQILDIRSIVAAGKAHNHNADVGLSPNPALNSGGSGLTLQCGRFFFRGSTITGSGNTIVAHGRTAIFIDGDLTIAGDFGVDVGSEGELDVFVSGNLALSGAGTVGSMARPAALRFYVAGSQAISIEGAVLFAANVYAPRALVTVGGMDNIYGGFFGQEFRVSGAHDMHYDRAILRSDGEDICPSPMPDPEPPGCQSDLECGPAEVCEAAACTPVLMLL